MDMQTAKTNVGSIVVYSDNESIMALINTGLFQEPMGDQCEFGIITSCNENYVFVKYGTDTTSKATSPKDISIVRIPATLRVKLLAFQEVRRHGLLNDWAVKPNAEFDGKPPACHILSVISELEREPS